MNKNNYSTKKLIAFDVDGTLTPSRSEIDEEMADLVRKLLEIRKVAIITGGTFSDIKKQVLDKVGFLNKTNKNLLLLPTNGGGLFTFDKEWKEVSSYKLSAEEKWKVVSAIQEVTGSKDRVKDFGDKIQDRNSEITYSALGEHAPLELKKAWDPDFKKRKALQKGLEKLLPEFEVKIGGTTSIDITPKGMDKAYAINKAMEYLKISKEDVLFLGDAVYKTGNDFPVFQAGIHTIKVSGPEETKKAIREIIS